MSQPNQSEPVSEPSKYEVDGEWLKQKVTSLETSLSSLMETIKGAQTSPSSTTETPVSQPTQAAPEPSKVQVNQPVNPAGSSLKKVLGITITNRSKP